MIKELVQFTESIADLKSIGIKPKEGLYIMLKIDNDDGYIKIDPLKREVAAYNKKMDLSESDFLQKCASIVQNTWMVSPNKCFDPSAKAIHSCSPYCVAFKREQLDTAPLSLIESRVKAFEDNALNEYINEIAKKGNITDKANSDKIEKYRNETAPKKAQEFKKSLLEVGKKFKENASKNKTQIYDRMNAYFEKAFQLYSDTEGGEKGRLEVFRNMLNSNDGINKFLCSIPEYGDLVDTDYVVIFLDESMDKITNIYGRYLKDKLFNTSDYNVEMPNGLVLGTSNFFNAFPVKKPFLTHQTASFDISGRISAKEAQELFDFQNIIGRKIFPNPLPIFIYDDEEKAALGILKPNALVEPEKRIGYIEILKEVSKKLNKVVGNYYLLFYFGGEIKDFDFVSRFEYELKNEKGENEAWQVEPIFSDHFQPKMENIFDLQSKLLPAMFNNALVVNTKTGTQQYKYFDEIDPQYCKTPNTYLLVMKYRKGFYDFIYKSQRKSITQEAFKEIMLMLILDDIKADRYEKGYNTERRSILEKMNILFSIHSKFQPHNKNELFMANQTLKLREFVSNMANGEGIIENDEQYAFTAGQVIAYLNFKSKSGDRSYSRLERFLNQSDSDKFNEAVYDLFMRYKHENFSKKFRLPFAEVTGYAKTTQMRKLMPLVLSGFFSPNLLVADKQAEPEIAKEEESIQS